MPQLELSSFPPSVIPPRDHSSKDLQVPFPTAHFFYVKEFLRMGSCMEIPFKISSFLSSGESEPIVAAGL